MQQTKKLSILLISDLHLKLEKLDVLKNCLKNRKFDMTFFSGDLTNIPQDKQSNEDQKSKFQNQVQDMISSIEEFGSQPKDKIYVLPGNHDHQIFYDPNFTIKGAINIEKQFIQISDDLYLTGFGGSNPGFVVETGEKAFEGYPYESEEEIQKAFDQHVDNIKDKCKDHQFIFMTHVGPDFSSTALLKHDYKQLDRKVGMLQFGTKAFNQFLDDHDDNILFYHHGHSHRGMGATSYKNTKIINPGSLMETDTFATIDLSCKDKKWKIDKISFEFMESQLFIQ